MDETPGYRLAVAAQYDALFAKRSAADAVALQRACAPYLARVLAALGPAPGPHLDIGCGAGLGALAVARANPDARVVASDIAPEALRVVREAAEALGLRGVETREDDAEAPGGGPYASATALSILNLLPDKRAALTHWRRVVDGPLVVVDGVAPEGLETRGAGPTCARSFAALAESAGWRVAAREDLTAIARGLRDAWPWPEYLRPGYAVLLARLDRV